MNLFVAGEFDSPLLGGHAEHRTHPRLEGSDRVRRGRGHRQPRAEHAARGIEREAMVAAQLVEQHA